MYIEAETAKAAITKPCVTPQSTLTKNASEPELRVVVPKGAELRVTRTRELRAVPHK